MNPWGLISILEQCDPSFQDLLYPKPLRCSVARRTAQAIEERWSAYFPTKRECRGPRWSLKFLADEPRYSPRSGSEEALTAWKAKISGTIAEGRAYDADISWRRFTAICGRSAGLKPFLSDFGPLAEFLVQEEEMWPKLGGIPIGMEGLVQREMKVLFAPGSPYLFADPRRLRFLESGGPMIKKFHMIQRMRYLLDLPLMAMAILQRCASRSRNSCFWLNLRDHIDAIIRNPSPVTFRTTWLEHAMRVTGACTKSGKPCSRKWAKSLLHEREPDLARLNAKAVEVNRWLKGKKRPSVATVHRSWQAVSSVNRLAHEQDRIGQGMWVFSWMITIWLEKHFLEVAAEFKHDTARIKCYYRRFFYYLRLEHKLLSAEALAGKNARQL